MSDGEIFEGDVAGKFLGVTSVHGLQGEASAYGAAVGLVRGPRALHEREVSISCPRQVRIRAAFRGSICKGTDSGSSSEVNTCGRWVGMGHRAGASRSTLKH